MVLEALAAVGLASNVIQFLHFLCKLLAEIGEVGSSTSGLSNEHTDIESVAQDLRRLTTHINAASNSATTPGDAELKHTAKEITTIADNLLNAITEFKTSKPRGTFKSFVHVLLQKFGKTQKVDKMATKLSRLQAQLNTQISVMLRYNLSGSFESHTF